MKEVSFRQLLEGIWDVDGEEDSYRGKVYMRVDTELFKLCRIKSEVVTEYRDRLRQALAANYSALAANYPAMVNVEELEMEKTIWDQVRFTQCDIDKIENDLYEREVGKALKRRATKEEKAKCLNACRSKTDLAKEYREQLATHFPEVDVKQGTILESHEDFRFHMEAIEKEKLHLEALEKENVWAEVVVSESDKRQLEKAKQIRDDIALICALLREQPLNSGQPDQVFESLEEELEVIIPQLLEMQLREDVRRNAFRAVSAAITSFHEGRREHLDDSDLSLKKLLHLHRHLQGLQQKKKMEELRKAAKQLIDDFEFRFAPSVRQAIRSAYTEEYVNHINLEIVKSAVKICRHYRSSFR